MVLYLQLRGRSAHTGCTSCSSSLRVGGPAFIWAWPAILAGQMLVMLASGDFIDPKTLSSLARSYFREAVRTVASVQSGLAAKLAMGIRWG